MPAASHLSPGGVRLLQEPQLAHLAINLADGSPQVTPVWVDVTEDGSAILLNTAEGRLKARNTGQGTPVAVSVADSANPYRTVVVRGTIAERRHEGADAHIDALAKKYLGQDTYPWRNPAEQRVMLVIRPTHVLEQGTE